MIMRWGVTSRILSRGIVSYDRSSITFNKVFLKHRDVRINRFHSSSREIPAKPFSFDFPLQLLICWFPLFQPNYPQQWRESILSIVADSYRLSFHYQ